jgi:hypothetical protein
MVQDMCSFLSEYSSMVLALHATGAVQPKPSSPRGPLSSRSWYSPRQWAQGGPYDTYGC